MRTTDAPNATEAEARYMSAEQLRIRWNTSTQTTYRIIKSLPHVRLGNLIRVDIAVVEEFEKRAAVAAAVPA